jgi:uncharacterized membrane protein
MAILALCWGVLTWHLGSRSLWIDELNSLQIVRGGLLDVVASAAADVHPPIYFLALHVWVALAGTSDLALRWPSVAAGLVAVALMPGVARAVAERPAALPAMLLLAFAPVFVEFSRMARYYALALALGLLATRLFVRATTFDRRRDWAGYGLVGLALLYTFYPSAALLPAHWGFLRGVGQGKARSGHWGWTALLMGVGSLPWLLAVAWHQLGDVAGSTPSDFARSVPGFALGVAASTYTFSVGENLFPWRPEAWLGLAAVAALIALALRRPARLTTIRLLGLALTCVVFVALLTTYLSVGTPFLNVPVRGLFALPFFLLALGASRPSSLRDRARWVPFVALGIVWMVSNVNQFNGQQALNPIYLTPAKEAATYLRQQLEPADLVIGDGDSVVGRYFVQPDTRAQYLETSELAEVRRVLAFRQPSRVWLVTLGRDRTREGAPADQVHQLLEPDYRVEQVHPYLPIDPVYLALKNRLLQRETYAYRLVVELYAPRQ